MKNVFAARWGVVLVGAVIGAFLTYRLCGKSKKDRAKPPAFP